MNVELKVAETLKQQTCLRNMNTTSKIYHQHVPSLLGKPLCACLGPLKRVQGRFLWDPSPTNIPMILLLNRSANDSEVMCLPDTTYTTGGIPVLQQRTVFHGIGKLL